LPTLFYSKPLKLQAMTSIISPFSSRTNTNDRIHQKFEPIVSDNDLLFLKCEKDGKIISIGITRRDYRNRQEQIANGLISDPINYSVIAEK
jgi:hypothetical protein